MVWQWLSYIKRRYCRTDSVTYSVISTSLRHLRRRLQPAAHTHLAHLAVAHNAVPETEKKQQLTCPTEMRICQGGGAWLYLATHKVDKVPGVAYINITKASELSRLYNTRLNISLNFPPEDVDYIKSKGRKCYRKLVPATLNLPKPGVGMGLLDPKGDGSRFSELHSLLELTSIMICILRYILPFLVTCTVLILVVDALPELAAVEFLSCGTARHHSYLCRLSAPAPWL